MEHVSYGVLRYVPDDVKQEVFNIGVVIHAPETRQVVVHLAEHDDTRLQYNLTDAQLYSYRKFAIELKRYVKSVNRHLVDPVAGTSLNDVDYLTEFKKILGEQFRIETLRTGVTRDIEQFSTRIFSSHVTQGKTRDPDVVRMLWSKFQGVGLDKDIQKRTPVKGSSLGVDAAFGYVNGRPHYIQPISIHRNFKENLKEGALWSTVVSDVERSGTESKFHFVIRKNKHYDEKSLEKIENLLKPFHSVELVDFDSELPDLISNVKADLQHGTH